MRILIGVVVVGLIAIVGIRMFSAPSVSPTGDMQGATTTDTTAGTGTTGQGTTGSTAKPATFRSLLTQSGNNECTYEGLDGSTRISDKVNISGGKMYGEFRTTSAAGIDDNSLIVYDGHYLYTWKEGKATGTKTVLSSLSQLPQAIPADMTSAFILGTASENIGWDCHSWLTDAKKLVPPTYVTFTSR